MIFNKKFEKMGDLEIYLLIIKRLSDTSIISSKARGVRYEIKIIDEDINFRRIDAKNSDKFAKITKEVFISIIKYIKDLREINVPALKPIIPGKQAPTLAILDYCELRV